jgi:2-phospho-L-lactate/phosphoenolpyruvate guanylyltransferase
MLRRTLAILRRSEALGGVIVVGKDLAVREVARDHDAHFFRESGSPGLNGALTQVAAATVGQGVWGLLVLPGDLPHLTVASIDALLNLGQCGHRYWGSGCRSSTRGHASPAAKHACGQAMVIASDRDGRGTNALLLSPPDLISFSFGPDSFRRHLAAARALGLDPLVYHSPALALDLDTPDDLDRLAKADLTSLLS